MTSAWKRARMKMKGLTARPQSDYTDQHEIPVLIICHDCGVGVVCADLARGGAPSFVRGLAQGRMLVTMSKIGPGVKMSRGGKQWISEEPTWVRLTLCEACARSALGDAAVEEAFRQISAS